MTHDARRLCRMPREGGTMLSGTPLWNQLSHIRLRKEEDDYDTVCSHDDEEDDQAEAKLYQPHANPDFRLAALVYDEVGRARYASRFILLIAVLST